MNLASIKISKDRHHFNVSGVITFNAITELRDQGDDLIRNCAHEVIFDFNAVIRSDSSALALLTSWARTAQQVHKDIKFINLKPQLMDIAKLSNLDKILTIQPSGT